MVLLAGLSSEFAPALARFSHDHLADGVEPSAGLHWRHQLPFLGEGVVLLDGVEGRGGGRRALGGRVAWGGRRGGCVGESSEHVDVAEVLAEDGGEEAAGLVHGG